MPRKILFTSPVQPIGGCSPDVYSWNKTTAPVRLMLSFLNHPGLRFLQANVPGVAILEYPTWDDFKAALREPVDILGISFYINETEVALQMVAYARSRGVRDVWAGNFGAYSPEVASYFDRVITGWGEAPVAEALGMPPRRAEEIVNPPMYGCSETNLLPHLSLHGILFTSRGCPFPCNFCQTPDFYGKPVKVSLASIDKALWTYARQGITVINILDENFGIFTPHTREVLRLLKKYGLRWMALCRVDVLLKHFEEWKDHGLYGAHLGVESLNADSLQGADKRLDRSKSIHLLQLMSRHNMMVQAFYIIGFEDDTVASVRADINELARLDVDLPQVQIVTPYPRTLFRTAISAQYGIFDTNLSKYNSRNLVWRHPHIEAGQMKELQEWANRTLFTSRRALRTISKVLLYDGSRKVTGDGMRRFFQSSRSGSVDAVHQRSLKGARMWSLKGWFAYEEVDDGQRLLQTKPLPSEQPPIYPLPILP